MNHSQIGNTELISTLNSRLVLQAVRVLQPTFRAEVARKTGLKPATVTSIVNDLIGQRLLREVPGAPASVAPGHDAAPPPGGRFGRPPLLLELNGDARRILAIDLEPDHLRVATTDLLGRILHYAEEPANRFDQPAAVIAQIVRMARVALSTIPKGSLLGIGVSLPGLIDSENGVLLSSTNMPRWKNVPIGSRLERELGATVHVERSMHLAALYEKWRNPQQQNRTVVIVSLRTGVGMSIVHRGQLYAGNSGLSGEIGHTVIDPAGKPCDCGSRGCLETFVSAPAVAERGARLVSDRRSPALATAVQRGEQITPELIYRLARDGDEGCASVVREVGRYLGLAIANLINLLAPDEIVIAGAIDTAEDLLLQSIREQVNASALPRSRENVVIRAASEKEKLPLLGAAVMIAQQMFELPELRHADLDSAAAGPASGAGRS